jgi:tetratricopeptide (TPR) repeat protein
MRKLLNFAVVTLFLTAAWGAEPKWIRMPSADFEIYSSANERDTRRVLQYFERVRSFFQQAAGLKEEQKGEPVHVIVFSSKKEYAQYRPNQVADAFYTQIAGRDYIVLGGVDDSVFPTAVHEYVHLVAQHGGLKLPPWLGEGLAELFSTLEPVGDKVLVGKLIPGRAQALLQDNWVPLATIVAADHDSPYYNEKNKAGSLYSEGWALTHMLDLSREYRTRFPALLDEIQKGTPSQKAIEGIYGKPLEDVEKALQKYLRSTSLVGVLYPVKMQSGEAAAAEPANMFDVKLALLDLANRPGKEAEVRERLQELIKYDPKRPEPHVGLGYLAARAGNQEEAAKSFEAALALGSRNPQMLWDYGRMAAQSKPEQATVALKTLLADQPGRIDVRLELAQIQINGKLPSDAIATLTPIKTVIPADAPRLFRLLAYADLQRGNRPASRINAQRWLDHTDDSDEKINANRLLRYLDEQDAAAARPRGPSTATPRPLPSSGSSDNDSRPKMARALPPANSVPNDAPPGTPAKINLPSITGKLVELDCKGPLPKFVLQTDSGRVSFVMDDPKEVQITGLPDATIDMQCGPQKQVAVRIQYDPPAAPSPGVMGIARAIHYGPEASKR